MTDRRVKEHGATVPERAKPRDATIIVPPSTRGLPGLGHDTTSAPVPLDSYPPPRAGSTTVAQSFHTQRELIVPSGATVNEILDHVQRPPTDRLQIEERVAAGGMGAIDIAVDRALDRRIAIKTLHAHLRSDEQSVRMFLREARLTGLLDHPHIVPVYDLGERENGDLFFAMKLVEGQTLAALIQSLPRGVLDSATLYTLLDVFTKVCDALAFAHSRGVIHCDVKPANVMVGEFGQVYLMDWGIARLISIEGAPTSITHAGSESEPQLRASATDNAIIGTPGYMSPEQARGDRKALDVRSDVFLLGAMLYEIVTQRPPYVSQDRHETLALAARGAFPNPQKAAGDALRIPLELERIILRAMATAPADRYATVAALKDDIVRFMRGGDEFPRRSFHTGDVIVREGDPGDAAYILVEGRCAVQKETPGGTLTLRTIGAGEVFGEMAILTEGRRTATVVAAEPTTVLVVTSKILEHEMAALKPWMATLLKSLASRFRDMSAQDRPTPAPLPARARVAEQIFMTVMTWGETDDDGGVSMPWTTVAGQVEAHLGVPMTAISAAAEHYRLAVAEGRLVIADARGLRARLAADLARTG